MGFGPNQATDAPGVIRLLFTCLMKPDWDLSGFGVSFYCLFFNESSSSGIQTHRFLNTYAPAHICARERTCLLLSAELQLSKKCC